MAKVEFPFHIDGNPDFRFALILESRSVEAHSLIDSSDNKSTIQLHLQWLINGHDGQDMKDEIYRAITLWKEKHK